jgi:protein tyrosine/serine phosphatase
MSMQRSRTPSLGIASLTARSQRRGVGALRASLACWLVLGSVFISGCVYFSKRTIEGACGNDLDSPIHNFCVVTPNVLWRGERPTKADAQWLVEHRVGTVVSLQLDDRRAFESAAVDQDLSQSVSDFHVPGFSTLHLLSPARLDVHLAQFIAIVRSAPQPIYVHCRAGVDRSGVLIAAYRILVEGVSPEEAIAEMGRFHSPWQHLDAHYIRGLSEARRQKILAEATDWGSRLRPTARIDCARGRCTYRPMAQTSGVGSGSSGSVPPEYPAR